MLKLFCIAIYLLSGMTQAWAEGSNSTPTEIYFVRHAETVSNATNQYNVKNDTTLSGFGKRQVKQLTKQLEQLKIDHIIVSPHYRALKTILPYLKKHQRTAEIWPSLDECCWQKRDPNFIASILRFKEKIELKKNMQAYFTFTDTSSQYRFDTHNYEEGIMQIHLASDRIFRQFSQSGKHILIIGEFHSGTRIIEMLQGIPPEGWYKPENAKIIKLKENSSGAFVLNSSISW